MRKATQRYLSEYILQESTRQNFYVRCYQRLKGTRIVKSQVSEIYVQNSDQIILITDKTVVVSFNERLVRCPIHFKYRAFE